MMHEDVKVGEQSVNTQIDYLERGLAQGHQENRGLVT
jgi:hypothetical protein